MRLSENQRATIQIKLDKAPSISQVVNISSDNSNITVSPESLTFNNSNYNEYQAVTLSALTDEDAINNNVEITLSSAEGVDNEIINVLFIEAGYADTPINPLTTTTLNGYTDETFFITEMTDTNAWNKAGYSNTTFETNKSYKLHLTFIELNLTGEYALTINTGYMIGGAAGNIKISDLSDTYVNAVSTAIANKTLNTDFVSEPFTISADHIEAAKTTNIFFLQFSNANTGSYVKAQLYIEEVI